MTEDGLQDLLHQAMQAIERADLASARELCDEALRRQPNDAAAMHLLGIMTHHEGGEPAAALAWLERAVAADPENGQFQNSRGVLLFEMGRYQEAAQSFYRATSLNPRDGLVWNNLGNALLHLGQPSDAEQCFRQALAVMPGLIVAINNLGLALKQQGDLEKAAICFQEAVLHQPDFVDAHFNLGELAYYTDDMEVAASCFRRAIEIDPNCRPAYASLAQVLHDQERPAEALALLQDAAQRFPDDGDLDFALRLQLSSMIPAWHIPMINDTERNQAYDLALRAAIRPGDLVLEIGTGSGLVSMMAARAGAGRVVTCEVLPVLAEVAQETVIRNGFGDRITVIGKKSTQLDIGTDLPDKADVFVSELLNIGMLAPNMLQVLSHARHHLVKPDARIIPAAARVYGALLDCPQLARINPLQQIDGFDMGAFDRFRSPGYAQIDLMADPHLLLSAPFIALDFDFVRDMPLRDSHRILVQVREAGIVHGIAFWFDLQMDEGTVYHSSSVSRTNHWKQAAEFFPTPIAVAEGDELAIEVGYDSTRIWFKPV